MDECKPDRQIWWGVPKHCAPPPPPVPSSKKNYIIFENTLSSDIEFFEIDNIVGVKKKNNIITIFLRGGLTHDIIFDTIKGDDDINEALNILREEITGS